MENLPLPAASGGGGGGDEDGTPESLNASINTFCEITSASQSEALFYLESHNYSLDSAVSTYLETTVSAAAAAAAAADTTVVDDRNPPAQLRLPSSQSDSDDSAADSPSASPSRSRSPSPTAAARRSQYNLRSKSTGVANSSRIRTLADLSRDDGSDSESDEPQGYYTGGEKSGMLVQDPSKANDVDAIFKQAREAGGIEGPAEHVNPSSSSRNFAGTARLLSGDTVTAAAAPQQPEIVTHNIVFWSNGFSVDGGPLRRLDDPQNASFLESIRKSECPEELQPADRRTPVHVNLTRKEEKYPVPKKTRSPFKGVGRTLGSTSDPTDEQAATEVTSFTSAPAPSIGLIVDESLPSTSIQLRLADGTRMVSRFNLGHTVRDIRGFIDASRPRGSRLYQLQTVGFPPKVLNELDQTIEQVGLGNSVVIQKL